MVETQVRLVFPPMAYTGDVTNSKTVLITVKRYKGTEPTKTTKTGEGNSRK